MCDAVAQQQQSQKIHKFIWVSMCPARLGETRQASVWALLCGSCPVRLPPRCDAESTTTTQEIL